MIKNGTTEWHVVLKPTTSEDIYVSELVIQHISTRSYVCQFILPNIPESDYELCVVPFDTYVGQYGPSSPCIYVHNPAHNSIKKEKLEIDLLQNYEKFWPILIFVAIALLVILTGFICMYKLFNAKLVVIQSEFNKKQNGLLPE